MDDPLPHRHTSPETVRAAKDSGVVLAFKLYPAGATTNSDSGVTDLRHCQAALAEDGAAGRGPVPAW